MFTKSIFVNNYKLKVGKKQFNVFSYKTVTTKITNVSLFALIFFSLMTFNRNIRMLIFKK